uniref:Cadherin N-terminal domain-containing protein n=1 Tax=Calidris pygmaea TaxID=425635 RepID=A0A8C3PNJ4_9CHAR
AFSISELPSRLLFRALLWCVLVAAWEAAWGELRYSVPEEMPKGSFVGDVAKDMGLELSALQDRGVASAANSLERTGYYSPSTHSRNPLAALLGSSVVTGSGERF